MRSLMKCSAEATAVKNARLTAGFSSEVANGRIMLLDASTTSAIRRPGIRHLLAREGGQRIGKRHGEERKPGQEQQERRVAKARQAGTAA